MRVVQHLLTHVLMIMLNVMVQCVIVWTASPIMALSVVSYTIIVMFVYSEFILMKVHIEPKHVDQ